MCNAGCVSCVFSARLAAGSQSGLMSVKPVWAESRQRAGAGLASSSPHWAQWGGPGHRQSLDTRLGLGVTTLCIQSSDWQHARGELSDIRHQHRSPGASLQPLRHQCQCSRERDHSGQEKANICVVDRFGGFYVQHLLTLTAPWCGEQQQTENRSSEDVRSLGSERRDRGEVTVTVESHLIRSDQVVIPSQCILKTSRQPSSE